MLHYPEGFTSLQQLLLLHILTHEPFDIVDFILAEIDEVITNGMGVVRQFSVCSLDQVYLFYDCAS